MATIVVTRQSPCADRGSTESSCQSICMYNAGQLQQGNVQTMTHVSQIMLRGHRNDQHPHGDLAAGMRYVLSLL